MKVINLFTNFKRAKTLPQVDLVLWAAGLVSYKKLGYSTKLYCTPNDISFLKENYLYQLYDEIDSEVLVNNKAQENINADQFWAARKIEIIKHELDLGTEFFYSDNDIIMREPIDFNHDVVVWSPEPRATNGGTIYRDWADISVPDGYVMPTYIKNCDDAYNCGILYFKDKVVYDHFYTEFYKFAVNNPCIEQNISKEDGPNPHLFMCNAEQRILKACLINMGVDVYCIMPKKLRGCSQVGSHYFWWGACWSLINKELEKNPAADIDKSYTGQIQILVYECLQRLKLFGPTEVYAYYNNKKWEPHKYK